MGRYWSRGSTVGVGATECSMTGRSVARPSSKIPRIRTNPCAPLSFFPCFTLGYLIHDSLYMGQLCDGDIYAFYLRA